MLNRRRLKALIKKEFIQIIKDPSSILISVVLPFILLFLYGFGTSLDLNHLKIGLLQEDHSTEAVSFALSLTGSPNFEVTIAKNRQELVDALSASEIRGFVVIPSYFTTRLKTPNDIAPIQVVTDGSEPNTAKLLQNYLQAALNVWMTQSAFEIALPMHPLISTEPHFWYNPNMNSPEALIPGSLGIILTLTGSLLTALVVSREWERGTMEALIATPMTALEFIFSKLIAYFALGWGSTLICLFVAIFGYEIPFRGSFWVFATISSCFLFSAMSIGLFISTIAKTQMLSYQLTMVTGFLPAYMLSGFIFEISSMPAPIRAISAILPARYFCESLKTLFLVGNVWKLLIINLIPLLIVGLLFFVISVRKTKKLLE